MAAMTPALVALTRQGLQQARRLQTLFPGAAVHGLVGRAPQADVIFEHPIAHLQSLFGCGRAIIGVCAAGVLIRALAPLVNNKSTEPPVIALAEDASAVVPLLGGHRGANEIARRIADHLNTTAAITSAGDRRFGVALDAPPSGWRLANPQHYKAFAAALLSGETVRLQGRGRAGWLQGACLPWSAAGQLTIRVTEQAASGSERCLVFHPAVLAVGVGCERGTAAAEVGALLRDTLARHGLAEQAVAGLFSIDIKADEQALHVLAAELEVPIRFFDAAALERQSPRLQNPSQRVFREVGCHGVAEGAALAAAGDAGELIVAKTKSRRATCAIARASDVIDSLVIGSGRGSLAVVGIGPGSYGWRTPEVEDAVRAADDLLGYRLYLDLLGPLAVGKQRYDFALGEEERRARSALELAASGRSVALVCSGDPGIYAMAALVFELLEHEANSAWQRVDVRILPGLSALQAAAARSGAPLGHDFCAISLSDLLTPWPVIEKRIHAAAEGDFVIAFYNPVSRRRTEQLARAVAILRRHRPAGTPVVLARNLGRAGERIDVIGLQDLSPQRVDMLTVVLVGSSETRRFGRWVYTPRGYRVKPA